MTRTSRSVKLDISASSSPVKSVRATAVPTGVSSCTPLPGKNPTSLLNTPCHQPSSSRSSRKSTSPARKESSPSSTAAKSHMASTKPMGVTSSPFGSETGKSENGAMDSYNCFGGVTPGADRASSGANDGRATPRVANLSCSWPLTFSLSALLMGRRSRSYQRPDGDTSCSMRHSVMLRCTCPQNFLPEPDSSCSFSSAKSVDTPSSESVNVSAKEGTAVFFTTAVLCSCSSRLRDTNTPSFAAMSRADMTVTMSSSAASGAASARSFRRASASAFCRSLRCFSVSCPN
mmetsp:Transcript_1681/g.5418  ORF Transcript_1681/g.5418 Transcript_1681/m.5418 type:complete len:289 (-) Transcript_1681:57-923(-)